MNEENNNIVPESGTIDNTEQKDNIISNESAFINETPDSGLARKNLSHNEDVSKVKIRTILKERFKNSNPFFKKVIPLVLVGIICFGAGLIAGKGLDRHRNERFFMNKRGMYRQLPGNFNYGNNFNKKQFNNKNSKQQNNKAPQAPQTPKSPPAATN